MALLSAGRSGRRVVLQATVDELDLGEVSFYDIAEHYSCYPEFVLLDSQTRRAGMGEVSFLAFAPFATFQTKGDRGAMRVGAEETSFEEQPFSRLDAMLRRFSVRPPAGAPRVPFLGGAIGYFAYELGRQIEVLPATARDDLHLPDCCLCFYNFAIALHHDSGKMYVCWCETPDGDGMSRSEVDAAMKQVAAGTYRAEAPVYEHHAAPAIFRPDLSAEEYCNAVRRIKQYIVAGDVYQVNMTQRFRAFVGTTPPWQIYKSLARSNPSDFAAYLNFDGHTIISSSPERFVYVSQRHVETRPIKGTIKRGATTEEDVKNREDLAASPKNRAELAMIVDLLRNDLGRVCVPGSVKVSRFPEVESYPSMHHLETTITGVLEQDRTVVDLIRATFPGGSITGAPKIRAMEIIDELEPVTRGVYTGSIGYLSFDGTADLNIAIRTLIVADGEAYVHAGGGVVADSDESEEYLESLLKASKLLEAVQNVSAAHGQGSVPQAVGCAG